MLTTAQDLQDKPFGFWHFSPRTCIVCIVHAPSDTFESSGRSCLQVNNAQNELALICQPGKVIKTGFTMDLEAVGSLCDPANLQVTTASQTLTVKGMMSFDTHMLHACKLFFQVQAQKSAFMCFALKVCRSCMHASPM